MYLCAFSVLFSDVCKLLLKVAAFGRKHALSFHFSHLEGDIFEAFVFEYFVDEFLAGVYFVALRIKLFSWYKHFCFDAHEGGDKEDEFAAKLYVYLLLFVDEKEKVFDNIVDGNIVNVYFVAFDKE